MGCSILSYSVCDLLTCVRSVCLISEVSWLIELQFIPIGIETLGPVGEDATRFLQELGRRIEAVTRDSRSMSFLWQRLIVAVKKRKCSVCVRHRTLGGVGHFGLFLTFHFFSGSFCRIACDI